jgi:hypothetical protein
VGLTSSWSELVTPVTTQLVSGKKPRAFHLLIDKAAAFRLVTRMTDSRDGNLLFSHMASGSLVLMGSEAPSSGGNFGFQFQFQSSNFISGLKGTVSILPVPPFSQKKAGVQLDIAWLLYQEVPVDGRRLYGSPTSFLA